MSFSLRSLLFLILAIIERGSTSKLSEQVMAFNQSVISGDNFQNFSKNEIRVSTVHFVPYMYQGNYGNFTKGMEYELLKMIAKMLNKNLSFQTTPKHSNICDNVKLNISDICIGGIFPRENALEHTDISVTYASDDLTWCVQKAGIMPKMLSQALFLEPESYFLLIFVYGYTGGLILFFLIQFDLTYEQRNNRDLHCMTLLVPLSVGLGLSPFFKPTGGVVRVFYGFMLIGGFFFFQITFTRAYEFLHMVIGWHQVSSFAEIIGFNFRLAGSPEAFNVLNQSEKISYQKMELFHLCDHINDCIDGLLYDYKLAVGGSRQNILSSPSYSPDTVFCFNNLEHIASYPIALYMRKDFYLKEQVNDIIQKLFEAGLFEKWYTDSRAEKYESQYGIPDQFRLPVSHVAAALTFLLGAGLLLAFLTFIFEHIVFWKVKQPVKHKIWIYLERYIDGKRHYFKNVVESFQEQNIHSCEEYYPYLE